MKKSTKPLGSKGETLAAEHLTRQGYRILATNRNLRYAEADLIVENKDFVVLVEVKTTSGHQFLYPAELVTPQKKQKLRRLAGLLMQENPSKKVRIDVVAIEMTNPPAITHIENAVEGS
jgi:putative endonuclease